MIPIIIVLTYVNMGQLYVILVIHTVVEAEKLKQVNIFISSLESIFITDTMTLPNGGTIIHGPISSNTKVIFRNLNHLLGSAMS